MIKGHTWRVKKDAEIKCFFCRVTRSERIYNTVSCIVSAFASIANHDLVIVTIQHFQIKLLPIADRYIYVSFNYKSVNYHHAWEYRKTFPMGFDLRWRLPPPSVLLSCVKEGISCQWLLSWLFRLCAFRQDIKWWQMIWFGQFFFLLSLGIYTGKSATVTLFPFLCS